MTILKSLLLTILYILAMEALAVWILIPGLPDILTSYPTYFYIQGTIHFLVGMTIFFFVRQRSFKGLIAPTKIHWYGIAILLGIAGLFMQPTLNWLYNLIAGPERVLSYDFNGWRSFSPLWIFIVLLIPLVEELVFKGYIQNNLQMKFTPWIAIPVAALLFAAIHAPFTALIPPGYPFDFHQIYIAFFIGLLSGWLFYKSKSVGPAFVCHAVTNLMVQLV